MVTRSTLCAPVLLCHHGQGHRAHRAVGCERHSPCSLPHESPSSPNSERGSAGAQEAPAFLVGTLAFPGTKAEEGEGPHQGHGERVSGRDRGASLPPFSTPKQPQGQLVRLHRIQSGKLPCGVSYDFTCLAPHLGPGGTLPCPPGPLGDAHPRCSPRGGCLPAAACRARQHECLALPVSE